MRRLTPIHMGSLTWVAAILCATCGTVSADLDEFLVINDIHYDFTYYTRRESCLPGVPPLEDVGTYGIYDCEGNDILLQNILDAMANTVTAPKFVIWLGDNPHHALNYSASLLSAETVLQVQTNLTRLFQETFPSTLVLPVIGNHDVFPRNQAPAEPNAAYDALLELWGDWIGDEEERERFRKAGYYSRIVDADSSLRVMVLNTNLYLGNNRFTEGLEDPGGQLAWVNATLTSARQDGEKVLIVLHVPMGVSEAENYPYIRNSPNNRLYDLISSNGDVIIGALTAHSHNDAFKIFFDDEGTAAAVIYAGGAATGYRGYWPGGNPRNIAFRVGRYGAVDDGETNLQDLVTYYLDLPRANTEGPVWQSEYSFREAYGIPSLEAEHVVKVLGKMKNDDSVFEKFRRFYYVSVEDAEYPSCDCRCKWAFLCSAEFIKHDDFTQCWDEHKDATCGAKQQDICVFAVFFLLVLVYFG